MKKYGFLFISLIIHIQSPAQQLTKQDYARAVSFTSNNLFNKKIFNINPQFNWFADSSGLSFINTGKNEKVFNKLEWKKMKIERMFDHNRLAKLLSDSLKKEIKATDLPLTAVKYINKSHIEFTAGGKYYSLDVNTYSLSLKKKEANNPMESTSPDG